MNKTLVFPNFKIVSIEHQMTKIEDGEELNRSSSLETSTKLVQKSVLNKRGFPSVLPRYRRIHVLLIDSYYSSESPQLRSRPS